MFDLDPSEEQPEILIASAIALRDLLSELGLESWVKTSVSKGFHIVVPLDGSADYDDRNAYHATFAAAYSVRAKPGAPVSAPCTWDEIQNGTGPRSFLLRGMADRVSTPGDVWSEMLMRGQTLRPAIERLRRLQA